MGQHRNASSPLTLAEVEGKLHVGMPLGEFAWAVAEHSRPPYQITKVFATPFLVGDPPRVDPTKEVRTYALRDADLILVIEFVGPEEEPEERVVSWHSEPVRTD